MTNNDETIEMLNILKIAAVKSHNDTAVLNVKLDSFQFVIEKAIKAIDPQKGKWKPNYRYGMEPNEKHFFCSECGTQSMILSNYCPFCGVRMVEPQESEDKE